jgi:hypothetical protein
MGRIRMERIVQRLKTKERPSLAPHIYFSKSNVHLLIGVCLG